MGFSDSAEHSIDVEERLKEFELQRIKRATTKPSLLYSGVCYYCGTPVPSPKPWCDANCRDDYEREQRILKMSGR